MNAVVTGIVTGSIVAIGAIGLAMVYNIAEVPNFAHGDLLTAAAYLGLIANKPGDIAVFEPLTTGTKSVTTLGSVVLFLLTTIGILGGVYALGGRDALQGEWWPVDPPNAVGLAVHLVFSIGIGLIVVLGLPNLFAAMLFAAAMLAGLSPLQEKFVFEKFRQRGATLAMMLIVSLALAFVIRYSVQTVFGGTVRSYDVDPSVSVFGTTIDVATSRSFDFYVSIEGVSFQMLDPVLNQAVVTTSHTWPRVAAMVVAGVAAGVAAYRWRMGERAVLGPYLLGPVTGIFAFVLAGVLLAGQGTPSGSEMYATRIKISYLRTALVLLAIVMMAVLHALLRSTKLGKAMRATSDNRDLAKIRGIDTEQVTMGVWLFTGIFAGIAGVTLGYVFGSLSINLGFYLLLPMFAAVILGGISIYGAILGSYVVGLSMELGIFLIPGVGAVYRVPIAFAVLFVVLIVKPEGIVS